MSTVPASCLCGNIKIEFVDEPIQRMLCHCIDCRKMSGGHYSDNAILGDEQFKLVSGTPKTFVSTADSGGVVTSHFCADCGSTMYRETTSFPGRKVIKVGTVDDVEWLGRKQPDGDLYAERKIKWLPELFEKKA